MTSLFGKVLEWISFRELCRRLVVLELFSRHPNSNATTIVADNQPGTMTTTL